MEPTETEPTEIEPTGVALTDGITTLRSPTDDDAPAVADAVRRSLETLSPWMPWAHGAYGLDDALAWARREIEPDAHPFVVLSDDRLVGTAGLNHIDSLNRVADLGYWLTADAVGQGHATRATRLLLRHAFETRGLHRIQILMSVENEPSRRVAERVGAVHEGVMRGRLLLNGRHHDAHLYAVTAD